jgi:hypothetical protein
MAKSSTRKKSKNKPQITSTQIAQAEQGVVQAIKYINDWKRRELLSLATTPSKDIPICIPIKKDAYLIGRLGLKRRGDKWVVIDSVDNAEYLFIKRSTAIIYSLCTQTSRQKLACKILQHESSVIKITDDVETFKFRKETARLKRDYWRVDHFDIMENCATYKLEAAKHQLEKSLQLAKYFKIW